MKKFAYDDPRGDTLGLIMFWSISALAFIVITWLLVQSAPAEPHPDAPPMVLLWINLALIDIVGSLFTGYVIGGLITYLFVEESGGWD